MIRDFAREVSRYSLVALFDMISYYIGTCVVTAVQQLEVQIERGKLTKEIMRNIT